MGREGASDRRDDDIGHHFDGERGSEDRPSTVPGKAKSKKTKRNGEQACTEERNHLGCEKMPIGPISENVEHGILQVFGEGLEFGQARRSGSIAQAVVNVIVDEDSLRIGDSCFDRMELLGEVQARLFRLDHPDDRRQMPLGSFEPLEDVRVGDRGMPTIGQQVRKGEVLAHVERPIIQADQATVFERMGDIEQQIALAEAKLVRARKLVEGGAGTRVSVSDLEIELEGLRRRRKTVNDIRTQPEILRAPADGVIASSRVAAGQVVGAQDVLFQIVDPKSLWVEALSFDASAEALPQSSALTTDGETLKLAPKGASRALQQQATVVHYAIENPPTSLRVGQPVTVLSPSGSNAQGIVLPRSSLVKAGNGEAVVWRHVDPERFEPRPVRIEPLDATRIIVRAGITEGDRVVVRGADLINQIR